MSKPHKGLRSEEAWMDLALRAADVAGESEPGTAQNRVINALLGEALVMREALSLIGADYTKEQALQARKFVAGWKEFGIVSKPSLFNGEVFVLVTALEALASRERAVVARLQELAAGAEYYDEDEPVGEEE